MVLYIVCALPADTGTSNPAIYNQVLPFYIILSIVCQQDATNTTQVLAKCPKSLKVGLNFHRSDSDSPNLGKIPPL